MCFYFTSDWEDCFFSWLCLKLPSHKKIVLNLPSRKKLVVIPNWAQLTWKQRWIKYDNFVSLYRDVGLLHNWRVTKHTSWKSWHTPWMRAFSKNQEMVPDMENVEFGLTYLCCIFPGCANFLVALAFYAPNQPVWYNIGIDCTHIVQVLIKSYQQLKLKENYQTISVLILCVITMLFLLNVWLLPWLDCAK